jgi:hypothetical protein
MSRRPEILLPELRSQVCPSVLFFPDTSSVEELERYQNNTSSKTRQLENELSSLQQQGEKLEREIILKRKTLEMLPSAGDNIGRCPLCRSSVSSLFGSEAAGHLR